MTQILQEHQWLAKLVIPLWLWDARQKFKRLEPFLKNTDQILELGSGLGSVTHYFREQGLQITPIDLKNLSLLPNTRPLIYDGKRIPFDDKIFDCVLVLTVLHHAIDPVSLLKEARRVGKRIIIIEDIYDNTIQQYLTYIADSLVNFEFQGHPHNNRTDSEWRVLWDELNLKMCHTNSYPFLYCFRQGIYVLET